MEQLIGTNCKLVDGGTVKLAEGEVAIIVNRSIGVPDESGEPSRTKFGSYVLASVSNGRFPKAVTLSDGTSINVNVGVTRSDPKKAKPKASEVKGLKLSL